MYPDGLQNLPSTVTVKPYAGWTQISTGLPAAGKDKWTRTAANYDILADSPIEIGNQQIWQFTVRGVPTTWLCTAPATTTKTGYWPTCNGCAKPPPAW
jgi:predicted metalloprotease with PDZ domain